MGEGTREREDAVVKKMASMLKSGAAMLEQLCPRCGVPLFRTKSGEVVCPSCGQRFIIVRSDEEELEVRGNIVLQELEQAAVNKLVQVVSSLMSTRDYSETSEVLNTALNLLRVIEYARRIRRGVEIGKTG